MKYIFIYCYFLFLFDAYIKLNVRELKLYFQYFIIIVLTVHQLCKVDFKKSLSSN